MICTHSGRPINECTCGYCEMSCDLAVDFPSILTEADDIYYELYRLHSNIMLGDTEPCLFSYQHNQWN